MKQENKTKQHFSKDFVLKNKYLIENLIGRGGYGQIFRAIDLVYFFLK